VTDACGNTTNCNFTVTLHSDCVTITEEKFSSTGTNGIDSYVFCIRNENDHDLGYVTLVDLPAGVSATP